MNRQGNGMKLKRIAELSPDISFKSTLRPHRAAAVVFLLSAVVGSLLAWRLEDYRLQRERARVSDIAGEHAHAIQDNIERSLSATYALAALVRQGKGAIPDFDATAGEMLPYYPGAASLQLAPAGVVRQIVPLAGNEKAIGHDLLKDPARTKEAFLARDTGKLTLAGPFNLVQGGIGAVGRLPVFLDNGKGGSSFWGFTIVLIRFPEALESARLSQLVKRGFAYELWRIHPDTGKKQVIAASSRTPPIDPVEHPLGVPNGTWALSVAPVDGWSDPPGLALKAALCMLFSLLMYVLTRSLVNTNIEAKKIAEKLTADLRESEMRYRSVITAMAEGVCLQAANGEITAVNPAAEKIISAASERILGRTSVSPLQQTFYEDGNAIPRRTSPLHGHFAHWRAPVQCRDGHFQAWWSRHLDFHQLATSYIGG